MAHARAGKESLKSILCLLRSQVALAFAMPLIEAPQGAGLTAALEGPGKLPPQTGRDVDRQILPMPARDHVLNEKRAALGDQSSKPGHDRGQRQMVHGVHAED